MMFLPSALASTSVRVCGPACCRVKRILITITNDSCPKPIGATNLSNASMRDRQPSLNVALLQKVKISRFIAQSSRSACRQLTSYEYPQFSQRQTLRFFVMKNPVNMTGTPNITPIPVEKRAIPTTTIATPQMITKGLLGARAVFCIAPPQWIHLGKVDSLVLMVVSSWRIRS